MRYLRYLKIILYNLLFRRNVRSHKVPIQTNLGRETTVSENVEIDTLSNIGKYTYIGQYTTITSSKIGNYCSIASFVKIGHGEHDLDKISTNSVFCENSFDQLTKSECIIGNDVWIGTDAVILRGVNVGNGVVIGANSVVNKDIPDFSIAVGSPARIIRKRFDDNKIKEIIKSNWWDYDFEDSKRIISQL